MTYPKLVVIKFFFFSLIFIILLDVLLHYVQNKQYIFLDKFKNTMDVSVNTCIGGYDTIFEWKLRKLIYSIVNVSKLNNGINYFAKYSHVSYINWLFISFELLRLHLKIGNA